jgi:RecB family endonuclease NucS
MVEGWIAKQPELLGLEILVIGRQVASDFGGRIDLLGIDADGNLVIVELKRDRTPREIVAQVLDYASWVAGLTTRQHDRAIAFLGRQLDVAATKAEATAASLSAKVFDKTEKLGNGHGRSC